MRKEPRVLGGFGNINFGKQFRQGNRVYDSNSCAMALTAQPLGNQGGYSYLYLVLDKKNEDNIMLRAEQSRAEQSRVDCCVIGCMDNKADHTFESANRVYDNNALCPTIPTSCGGGHTPKVITKI